MKISKEIELQDYDLKPFDCELSISFKSRDQRDAFILLLISDDITWEFSVEGSSLDNTYEITIYSIPWGDNLINFGKLLKSIDGSDEYDI